MLKLIKRLSMDTYAPLAFVVAASDHTSEEKARVERKDDGTLHFYTIPRSREVGQSWVSTVFTTAYSFLYSVWVVFHFQPDVLVCNGPGNDDFQLSPYMHPHLRSAARPPLSRAPTIVQADLLRVICACAASVAVRSAS
ncbi:hypothetical protein AaE_001374, partial [Aphanomyces astaci]